MARTVVALIAAAVVVAVPAALAKDFRPGDLRLCGHDRCVTVVDKPLLHALEVFYYSDGEAPRANRVPRGTGGYLLRLRNGYATGIVAGPKLGRFQSYGVVCGRFVHGRWYRVPARAATALRRLTAHLRPVRVSAPPRSC